MYLFEGRIRYSETDREGKLTVGALLDYFQDCATFHSEDLGLGIDYLKEKNLVWVLSTWQITVNRFPELCEHVTVGTFPYAFKGCFGYRNFFMKDAEGNYIAKANSLWTLLDRDSFKPAHLTDEMKEKYVPEEKLPMDYEGRKIQVPENGEFWENLVVEPRNLDTNQHVNNGQYVSMALDFLPEGFQVSQLRAEYRKQALLHDVLRPYVACEKGENERETWVVSLQNEKGEIFVKVEFEGKGMAK